MPTQPDFLANLQSFADEIAPIIDYCDSEEQTKMSVINPYIDALGFDVRDPRQVRIDEYPKNTPKSSEKVDYAILDKNNKPSILIEAKSIGTNLSAPRFFNQINSYVHRVKFVKFVVLTNGVEWHWYHTNKHVKRGAILGDDPFLTHDVLKPQQKESEFLIEIAQRNFDQSSIHLVVDQFLTMNAVNSWIKQQRKLDTLDEEFVQLYMERLFGKESNRDVDLFKSIWASVFSQFSEQSTSDPTALVNEKKELKVKPKPTHKKNQNQEMMFDFMTQNGTITLKSTERQRAWRKIDSPHYRICNNQKILYRDIIKYFAQEHYPGEKDYYESLERAYPKQVINEITSSEKPIASIPLEYRFILNTNLSSNHKESFLRTFAKFVRRKDEGKIKAEDLVEWYLDPDREKIKRQKS